MAESVSKRDFRATRLPPELEEAKQMCIIGNPAIPNQEMRDDLLGRMGVDILVHFHGTCRVFIPRMKQLELRQGGWNVNPIA